MNSHEQFLHLYSFLDCGVRKPEYPGANQSPAPIQESNPRPRRCRRALDRTVFILVSLTTGTCCSLFTSLHLTRSIVVFMVSVVSSSALQSCEAVVRDEDLFYLFIYFGTHSCLLLNTALSRRGQSVSLIAVTEAWIHYVTFPLKCEH